MMEKTDAKDALRLARNARRRLAYSSMDAREKDLFLQSRRSAYKNRKACHESQRDNTSRVSETVGSPEKSVAVKDALRLANNTRRRIAYSLMDAGEKELFLQKKRSEYKKQKD